MSSKKPAKPRTKPPSEEPAGASAAPGQEVVARRGRPPATPAAQTTPKRGTVIETVEAVQAEYQQALEVEYDLEMKYEEAKGKRLAVRTRLTKAIAFRNRDETRGKSSS